MIGLVLEGGGAKGAYHIGVFRALQELDVQLSGVVGTSIGAINGAMIAQGDGEKAWQLWSQIHNSDIFDIRQEMERELRDEGLTKKNWGYVVDKVRTILKRGGLNTSVMMRFLSRCIREEDIRQSEMDFGLVTVSLTTMKPLELLKEDIPQGQMLQYIMASASFPGFKAEKVDGQAFIDGGVWNNLPVNLLIDKGYDELIAVRTNAIGRNRKIDTSFVNVCEIEPSEELASMLDFNEETAQRDLNLGYHDTLRLFRSYLGRRYTIAPHPDPDWFFHYLGRMDEKKIQRAGELLGINPAPPKRMLFEHIIPRLAAIFGVPESADYQDMALEIYEVAATALDLPRFQVYGAEEFVRAVERRYPQETHRLNLWIPGFVKTSPHLSKLVKKEVLGEVMAIFLGEATNQQTGA